MSLLHPGRTAVMGILNVTPDSFSDGGSYSSVDAAVEAARRMVDDGADIIDVGGESTRPGADEVAVDVEIARTAPVIERVAPFATVSIDTRKAVVAKAALDAGAVIVNDVSGGTHDEQLLPLVADRGVDVVLMHMRGTPKTMHGETSYPDVVSDIRRELADRVSAAEQAGVDPSRISVDPGLGFAKTAEQSLEVVRRIGEFARDAHPVVVGPSRKRFIGGDLADRLAGTIAVAIWCAQQGVAAVRVHDVGDVRRALDMAARLSS